MSDSPAMPCPVCRVPLVMSERQGVEIDDCPQCRGVWLDLGELYKIIERNAQEHVSATPARQAAPPQNQPRPQDYGRDHDRDRDRDRGHGHGHYPKRRKSFLEELFD